MVAVSSSAGPARVQSFKGSGLATLQSHPAPGGSLGCTFSHLQYSFPLKLITPRGSSRDATSSLALSGKSKQSLEDGPNTTTNKPVAALYLVGYGGGLVSGDDVRLDVDVGNDCRLLLLTQGSTKVFKMRAIPKASSAGSSSSNDLVTRQHIRFLLRTGSTLLLLPSPVTCYASSRYRQEQYFDLQCRETCSLVLLDWLTPGREHLSSSSTGGHESWRFESYYSSNHIRVQGRTIVRDRLLLSQPASECSRPLVNPITGSLSPTELARRNAPYSCYANVFLVGPEVQELIHTLDHEFQQIQQKVVSLGNGRGSGPQGQVEPLLWSMSILEEDLQQQAKASRTLRTAVLRIAAMETEQVRAWLHQRLRPLEAVVGSDLYKQTLW